MGSPFDKAIVSIYGQELFLNRLSSNNDITSRNLGLTVFIMDEETIGYTIENVG